MIESNRTPIHTGGWYASAPPPPPSSEKPEKKVRKSYGAGLVVAVQSVACVVILLLALLLKVAGGDPYAQLCQKFQEYLQRNDLLAAVAALWDGNPQQEVSSQVEEMNENAPAASLPDGVAAVPLRVNLPCVPPLSAGTLTSGYGYRNNPTGSGVAFHHGVDIAAPAGAPIVAMLYGRVTAVGENTSYGRYVRLSHGDGVEVLYAHCSAVLVSQDAVLRAGETVALVGATGDATGNHVHIEVSGNGRVYDPSRMVSVDRYV